MISFINKQFDKNNFKVWLYTPGGSFLGELIVDNPVLTLQLEGLVSTFNFTIPENVEIVGDYGLDSIVNPRINETLDQFQVEVWYGDLDTDDYQKERFVIIETPNSFTGDITNFSYKAYSKTYDLKFMRVLSWPGVLLNEYVDAHEFTDPLDFDSEQTVTLTRTAQDPRLIRVEIEKDFVYRLVNLTATNDNYTFTSQPNTDSIKLYKYVDGAANDVLLVEGTDYDIVVDKYTDLVTIDYIFGNSLDFNDIVYMEYKLASPITLQLIRSDTSTLTGEFDFYYNQSNDTIKCYVPAIPKVFRKDSAQFYDSTIPADSSIKVNIYYEASDLQAGDTTFASLTKNSLTIDQVVDSLLSNYGDEDNDDAKWSAYYSSALDGVLRSNFDFNNTNLFAAINNTLQSYEAIAIPDTINKRLYIYKKDTPGTFTDGGLTVSKYRQSTGLSLEYGKYLRGVTQTISTEEIVTIMRGIGNNNITAASASPTGYNEYEDYTYYLDGAYLSNTEDLLTQSSITPVLVGTSRWMSDRLTTRLLCWQLARNAVEGILYENLPNVNYTVNGITRNPAVDFNIYTSGGLILAQDAIVDLIAEKESDKTALQIQVTEQETLLTVLETSDNVGHLVEWAGTFDGTSYSGVDGYIDYIEAKKVKLDIEVAAVNTSLATLQEDFDFINGILQQLYTGIKKDNYNTLLNANFDNYLFETEDFVELSGFRREGIYENKFITKASELYLQLKEEIVDYRQPRVEVSADMIGLLQTIDARPEWNSLVLGGLANIVVPRINIDIQIQIKTLTISPDANSTSITFSTQKNYIGTGQKFLGRFFSNAAYNLTNNLGYKDGQWTQAFIDATDATNKLSSGFLVGADNPLTTKTIVVNDEGITTNGYTIDPQNDTVVSADSDVGRMLIFGFVKINAGRIDVYNKNRSGQVLNSVVVSPTGVLHTVGDLQTSMTADGFAIVHDGSTKFSVDENGNAVFAGALNAATGTFNGSIQIGSGENVFKADTNGIYLGNETFASAEFRVTPAGALTATSATVSGTISASGGSIGALAIQSDGLRYSDDFQIRNGELRIGGSGVFTGIIASPKLVIDGTATGSQQLIYTSSGSFSLTADGDLTVAGQVEASSGTIGDLAVQTTGLDAQLSSVLYNGGFSIRTVASNGETELWLTDDTNYAAGLTASPNFSSFDYIGMGRGTLLVSNHDSGAIINMGDANIAMSNSAGRETNLLAGSLYLKSSAYISSPASNNSAWVPAAHYNSSTSVLTLFLPGVVPV